MSALPNQTPGLVERIGLTREDVDRYVWAIELPSGRWHGVAAASVVLRAMGGGWWLVGCLATLPGAGLVYALVARARGRVSQVWGDPPPC